MSDKQPIYRLAAWFFDSQNKCVMCGLRAWNSRGRASHLAWHMQRKQLLFRPAGPHRGQANKYAFLPGTSYEKEKKPKNLPRLSQNSIMDLRNALRDIDDARIRLSGEIVIIQNNLAGMSRETSEISRKLLEARQILGME
jgi:hypothetical protein